MTTMSLPPAHPAPSAPPRSRRRPLALALASALAWTPAAIAGQASDPPPGEASASGGDPASGGPPAAGTPTGPAVPPPPVVGPRTPGSPGDPLAPRRIIQGREDVGPLSTAQQIDLRRDVDGGFSFGSVYRQGDLLMRTLGALRAVFPRSEYMSPRAGVTVAGIPAGTRFQIGAPLETPVWQHRAGMIDPSLAAGLITDGRSSSLAVSPEAGAVPVDPRTGGRVIGTGLAGDPVVQRARLGLTGPANDRVDDAARAAGDPRTARSARTAIRPSDGSRSERPRAGAASPPRRMSMPAIVDDPSYRRERLRAILGRAVAEAAARPANGQAARGPSSSSGS